MIPLRILLSWCKMFSYESIQFIEHPEGMAIHYIRYDEIAFTFTENIEHIISHEPICDDDVAFILSDVSH